MVNDLSTFIAARIETVADDAYRSCVEGLDRESQTVVATALWALPTAMFVHLFEFKKILDPPFEAGDAIELIGNAAAELDLWAMEEGIGDGKGSDAKRLASYVSAMRARLFEHQLGRHENHDLLRCMAEGVPTFLSILMDQQRGAKVLRSAVIAAYTPAEEVTSAKR